MTFTTGEKAIAGFFGFLILTFGIMGCAVFLHKQISHDAVAAYQLIQAKADNAEILKVQAERDAAITKQQKTEDMLRSVESRNERLSARQRALNIQLCRDHPESCPWKGSLPRDTKP